MLFSTAAAEFPYGNRIKLLAMLSIKHLARTVVSLLSRKWSWISLIWKIPKRSKVAAGIMFFSQMSLLVSLGPSTARFAWKLSRLGAHGDTGDGQQPLTVGQHMGSAERWNQILPALLASYRKKTRQYGGRAACWQMILARRSIPTNLVRSGEEGWLSLTSASSSVHMSLLSMDSSFASQTCQARMFHCTLWGMLSC